MKQHPLCTDCERELDVTNLPIPTGLKREWSAMGTRRQFLGRSGKVLGWAALARLFGEAALRGRAVGADAMILVTSPGRINLGLRHFAPMAKRAIYLFLSGGPPLVDLL